MGTRLEAANSVKASVSRYYTKKRYCVNTEVGLNKWGALRADVIALSMKREIIIVEVKSSVADFKGDDKYENYKPYCNKLYIAAPEHVALKIRKLIAPGVGLMALTDSKIKVIKSASRQNMDPTIVLNIITRLAFRNADANRYKRIKNR